MTPYGSGPAWLSAVEGLAAVHARLWGCGVVVDRMPAVDFIRKEDGEQTLFYLDPPYLAPTRTAPKVYAHEMSEADHRELLDTVRGCKGKVILSGYPNALYDEALASWNRHDVPMPNHAAGGRKKRTMTEVLWCNY